LLAGRAGDRGDPAEDQHAGEHVAGIDGVAVAMAAPSAMAAVLDVELVGLDRLLPGDARQLDRRSGRCEHGKGRGDGGRGGQLGPEQGHLRSPTGARRAPRPMPRAVPGLRKAEPGAPQGARFARPSQAPDAAVVEVDHPAMSHLAGELAGVVAAVAVVPAAPVVAPPAAPVGIAGVDRDPALDGVAVALAVDVANVGHLGRAAPRIAARVALGGVDALLDGLARVARGAVVVATAAAVVVSAVVTVIVARRRGYRGDPADDQRTGNDVAGIDAVVATRH